MNTATATAPSSFASSLDARLFASTFEAARLNPKYHWPTIYKVLGIPLDYPARKGWPAQQEAVERDLLPVDNAQHMQAQAAGAWARLRRAAAADGVVLGAYSAFRSVPTQVGIIAQLLQDKWTLDRVFQGVAPPGYSEHHTGRAVDVMDAGGVKLTRGGPLKRIGVLPRDPPEFEWMQRNAGRFGFRMTYPAGNPLLIEEPWHWMFIG